jgi:hypothetical protein
MGWCILVYGVCVMHRKEDLERGIVHCETLGYGKSSSISATEVKELSIK